MPRTIRYGDLDDQIGDLYLPPVPGPIALCLLHGGFWRRPYGREELSPIALDLVGRGYPVWNLEYRRVGSALAEWPAPIADVRLGIRHLATQVPGVRGLIVIGHSAGGHLALLAGANDREQSTGRGPAIRAVVGLAPVSDLHEAFASGLGRNAVRDLLGATPTEQPARYLEASPLHRLPFGCRQLLLHGADDAAVPAAMSRRFAQAAREAGDEIDHVELPSTGHMDFLEPTSHAHGTLVQWLARLCAKGAQ